MAYEFLKKLFGTPKDGEAPKAMTYAELEAAIDADKKIKVVDIKAGGYVAKETFDTKETELDGVKSSSKMPTQKSSPTKTWILTALRRRQRIGRKNIRRIQRPSARSLRIRLRSLPRKSISVNTSSLLTWRGTQRLQNL